MDQKLEVSAIREGTVIDHIRSSATFKVASILRAESEDSIVLVGVNLSSKTIGRKGIIKIENKDLSPEEANRIALIAPDATLNIIKDFKVVSKKRLTLPEFIEGIVKCFNPNCVSNHEPIRSKFFVVGKDPIKLRCYYCDRYEVGEDVILL